MLFAFAQLCALFLIVRPLRGLLLPMGLLFLPVYDMTYPRPPSYVDACAKETYVKGQERSKAIALTQKCVERKESEWHVKND